MSIWRPRLYVGTYGKYNSGNLDGAWFDLSDYETKADFIEACREYHKDEEDPEFMFQDYDNMHTDMYSECCVDEDFFEFVSWVNRNTNVDCEMVYAYVNMFEWDAQLIMSEIEDAYMGKYESKEDFALEHFLIGEDIPEHVVYYLDWDSITYDMFLDDYVYDNESGCVFVTY